MTTEPNFDNLTTWHLADLARCGSPDRGDGIGAIGYPVTNPDPSPGAQFLRRVARDTAEAIRHEGENFDPDEFDAFELVDAAVPIYTHDLWATFVDLAAYNEDPSELGYDSDTDMGQLASVCLYLIAVRLADALARQWADERAEAEEVDA